MQVALVDFTGCGKPDPAAYAAKLLVYTKNTRLTQGEDTRAKINAMSEMELETELSYIANTIRSSWEFIDYTFEITDVSRAFTHQFVRTRTGSYAQQSQRSVDMSGFDTLVPWSVIEATMSDNWKDLMDHINNCYQQMLVIGIPAQDARGILPTNILTNIIAKFNLRTMADLLGKRKSLRAQGEYQEVAQEMEKCILAVHPWAAPFLNPERTRTPALDAILKESLGDATPFSKVVVNNAIKELELLKETWG